MLLRAITSVYSSGGDRGGVGLGHEQQNTAAHAHAHAPACESLQGEAEVMWLAACMHGNLERMAGPRVTAARR